MPSTGTSTTSVPARLVAFAAALLVAGLLGAGVGTVVGPIDVGGGHDEAPVTTVPAAGDPSLTDPAGGHPSPTHEGG